MKTILIREFGAPEVMKIEDVQSPDPEAGQISVSLKASGVNPVDTYIRSGSYARKPGLPYTPGNDGAGIVKSAGSDISSFKPGDRVWLSGSLTGTYSEETLCAEEHIHLLPDNVSFQEGACLGIPYPTAFRALMQKAQALPGEWILIHGATGGVGLAAVQLAVSRGCRVIATGGTEEGRKLVRDLGADFVLDHHSESYTEDIFKITEGRGVNAIIEMLANVNLSRDLKMIAAMGRIVVIGNRGEITINPRDAMVKDASILGMIYGNTPAEEVRQIHAALEAGLRNGTLKPVVRREYPLEKAAEAHRDIMKSGACGNLVIKL